MLQHVEAGRRTEIEALNGALIREAQALGIPTPNNEAVVALLKGRELHQQRRIQCRHLIRRWTSLIDDEHWWWQIYIEISRARSAGDQSWFKGTRV